MDGLGLQPAPSSRSPLSARAFGAEVLLGELIGRGGMSRVYRGWMRGNGLEVAVKVLRDDLTGTPEAVQRFVRERDLLAAVAGPHVVRVHDLVVHDDEIGIVMDLVAGGHLRRAVSFPCPPAQAAELTAQIADGLAAVHATGVIHRDLKPENVLVDRDESGGALLRLTDFGISRLVDTGTLTQTTVTGTPGYLSPEVAAGGKVTAAADVYALGVILYELCAGRGPFLADNPLVLILAATRQAAPRPGGMPDALWELLASMLGRNPVTRPSAAEIASALRALAPSLADVPVCSPPPPTQAVDLAAELSAPIPQAPFARPASPQAPFARPEPPGHVDLTPPGGTPYQPRSRRESLEYRHGGAYGGSHGGSQGGLPGAEDAEIAPWRRPKILGLVGAAAAALAVVGVIASGAYLGGSSTVPVVPVPTTSAATQPTAPTAPSSPRPTPTSSIRTVAPPSPTASPSRPTVTSGTTTSASPSPTPSPGVPTLDRSDNTPAGRHASDQELKLTIAGVSPGAGTLASITVAYDGGGTQRVDIGDGKAASYDTVIEGLTNGNPYTFTATVCSSTKLCTSSAPFLFTPYGAPEVQAPVLSVSGLVVNVQAGQVIRHSHPGTTTCTIAASPADGSLPERQVDPGGETFTFTGKAATAYTVTERCETDGISDGSEEATVTTGGVAPAPLPSPSQSPAAPVAAAKAA